LQITAAATAAKNNRLVERILFFLFSSKAQLHGKLQFPRIIRARNHAEIRCPENPAGQREIRMVRRIVEIDVERRPGSFPESRLLATS
jgi:hypothetical protein